MQMLEHLFEMTLIREAGEILETWIRIKLLALSQKLPENRHRLISPMKQSYTQKKVCWLRVDNTVTVKCFVQFGEMMYFGGNVDVSFGLLAAK